MKILQISSARSFGGGERHLVDLAKALAARGHDLYLALAPGSPLAPRLRQIPADNIFTFSARSSFSLGATRKLARLIREHEIEIVHAHLARDYPVARLAVHRQPRAQLFFTRHVLFPLGPLHRLTFARAARIIAVSEAVALSLRAQRLCPEEKIIRIPNGIDFSELDEEPERSDSRTLFSETATKGEFLIGTVGELSPVKGQEALLRAAARILAEFPEARFLLAGEDTSPGTSYRRRLERLSAELDLAERVKFLGWVDEIAPFLKALDIFVSTSSTESFGLAMAEAMACGVPVVATQTEGARALIGDGEGGSLVPTGDASALAEAIVSLLREPAKRKRMGERARKFVRGRFSLDRMVEETERLYRQER